MKNTEIVSRLFSILAAAVILSSCAHEGPKLTDGLASETSTDTVTTPKGTGDEAATNSAPSDLTESTGPVAVSDTAKADASAVVAETAGAADSNLNKEMESTETAPANEDAKTASVDATAAPLIEEPPRDVTSAENAPSFQMPDSDKVASVTPEVVAPTVGETSATAVVAKKVPHHRAVHSIKKVADSKDIQVSQLPERPVDRNGKILNRFYFLRRGDTPESVATRIFGTKDHAEDLVAWNGDKSTWKTGDYLLYQSPTNQEDPEMHSYFDDQQMKGEPYVMTKAVALTALAERRYGDSKSWKEIAALNGIHTLADAKEGMQINLFPSKLPDRADLEVPNLTVAIDDKGKLPVPNLAAQPVTPPPPPVAVAKPLVKPATNPMLAQAEVGGGFFQRHPEALAAAIAAGSVFLFAIFLYRRRKSASHLDYPE